MDGLLDLRSRATLTDEIKIGPTALALDLLQAVYRNPGQELHVRMRAASIAIAYETPKLLATAIVSQTDFAALLDKRIAHYEALEKSKGKTIEHQPVPEPPPPEPAPTRAPLARLYDHRRYPRRF